MKHSYMNILREPDRVLFRYDDSDSRFEEPDTTTAAGVPVSPSPWTPAT